jgi:hypothetical protein
MYGHNCEIQYKLVYPALDDLESPTGWKFTESITFHFQHLLAYPALIPRVQNENVDQRLFTG